MGVFYDEIPDHLVPWIRAQKLFWVASAPLNPNGHVNISPKGYEDTFHIVNSHQVWYEDLSGSGVETIAHVRENGRITIMFNAFDGGPRIVRLFGKARAFEFDTPEYNALIPTDQRRPGSRSAIVVDVYQVGSSCGFGVPFFEYKGPRTALHTMAVKFESNDIEAKENSSSSHSNTSSSSPSLTPEEADPLAIGLKDYWKKKNLRSLDGLPGLQSAPESSRPFRRVPSFMEDGESVDLKAISISKQHPNASKWLNEQTLFAFTSGVATAVILFDIMSRRWH